MTSDWAAPVLKGFVIGVAVAAPVGPMSVLLMRRTLVRGWGSGIATGLGIAAGDATYAVVAALGLASIAHFMLAYARPLHLLAGVVLIGIAVRAFAARPATDAATAPSASGASGAFGSALILTLTNPPTIVSFVAIFTALAPAAGFVPASARATVSGVFIGSTAWWLFLTTLVTYARRSVGPGVRGWIDRLSAAVLGVIGLAEIRRAV